MTIAAVVVTYNRKELLTECLTAIAEQTRIPDTILIIDNASTDGTEEMFAKDGVFDNALFDYQKMESNLGGAGGFYEGIRRAFNNGADWIWIMDDDTIPSKTALEEICNAMRGLLDPNSPNIGGIPISKEVRDFIINYLQQITGLPINELLNGSHNEELAAALNDLLGVLNVFKVL